MDLSDLDLIAFDSSIEYFARTVLSEHITTDIPPFHSDMYALARNDNPRKCVVVPRGFGKSTVITLVFTLWSILMLRERFIVIVSDSHHQAKLFLESIAVELEYNPVIRQLWGNLKTEQWSQESITTTTGIRVVAKGTGQKIRGLKFGAHRPTLIIFDDCENDELVSTPEQRAKLKHWFYAAALPALSKNPPGKVCLNQRM